MHELGGGRFCRIGWDTPPLHGDAADYVLSSFSRDELALLPRLLDGVVDLLELLYPGGAGEGNEHLQ